MNKINATERSHVLFVLPNLVETIRSEEEEEVENILSGM